MEGLIAGRLVWGTLYGSEHEGAKHRTISAAAQFLNYIRERKEEAGREGEGVQGRKGEREKWEERERTERKRKKKREKGGERGRAWPACFFRL